MKFIFGMLTGILLSTMFFIWYAKKNLVPDNNTSTEQVVATTATDENGFEAFYERFHSDSLFQIAHITFPLEGVPRLDSLGRYPEGFRWQQENWLLHRPFDIRDSSFVQNFIPLTEGIIVEEIRDVNGLFSMQRRFARIGEEWRLIYYASMNQIRQEE
ncbi:MAG: hypothetical protein ACI8YQ_001147 [Polaribacter sp.]|jgi:hypothetical protein